MPRTALSADAAGGLVFPSRPAPACSYRQSAVGPWGWCSATWRGVDHRRFGCLAAHVRPVRLGASCSRTHLRPPKIRGSDRRNPGGRAKHTNRVDSSQLRLPAARVAQRHRATTGMWASALIAFALCRHLPWMPTPTVTVPRCHAVLPHCFVDTAAQGPMWLGRRMLADFTDAQFIGNEWASGGLPLGTVISYLLNPELAGTVGQLLPRLVGGQILTAALAVTLWHRQWASYGWYPTFVPVVSIAPAVILAFGGTLQSIVAGAVLGALIGPPLAAAVARRLPIDFHPFIGNVVSMASGTAIVVTALSVLPGFD